jgi:hypothetical protein
MMFLFNCGFGVVVFIVQNNPGGQLRHFFIEWNLAPGWTLERTELWYESAFTDLQNFDQEALEAFSEGILVEDLHQKQNFRKGNNRPLNWDALQFEYTDRVTDEELTWREELGLNDMPEPIERNQRDIEEVWTLKYGPVLAVTADTTALLRAIPLDDPIKYHEDECAGCGARMYVMTRYMIFSCPSCGAPLICEP